MARGRAGLAGVIARFLAAPGLRRAGFIVGFLAAPMLLYVVYVLYPQVRTVMFSLTDFNGLTPDYQYIGFGNYLELFKDEVFLRALFHNLVVLTLYPIITILIALFFAFMLNVGGRGDKAGIRGVLGSSVYKFIFFFPQVMSIAIVAVVWSKVLQSNEGGLINGILMKLGIVDPEKPLLFLGEEDNLFGIPKITVGDDVFLDWPVVLICLIGIAVWGGVGFYLVLFSAAMQSIPKDIYEAAVLDGSTRAQTFFKVTLPLLREHISVAWVYLGIAAMDFYALVLGLTPEAGGPRHASEVMSSAMMNNAFRPSRYDAFAYACAMGASIALITLLFAVLQLRMTRSRDRLEF